MPHILAIVEVQNDAMRPSSREVVHAASAMASALGADWAACVLGASCSASLFKGAGVSQAFIVEDARLSNYDVHAAAAAQAVRDSGAGVVLMAATATGKDLMARTAQLLRASLAQDCIGFQVGEKGLEFTRPLYGGKVLADVRVTSHPALATIRPRSFPASAGDLASRITKMQVSPPPPLAVVTRQDTEGRRGLDVTEADIVVSGGRGMQGPENWHVLEDLVEALGPRATLACSRPVSDSGWRPRAEHVGQTGRTITPDLYIACGISGAIQHMAGITGSKCIVAINKDPDAPVFKMVDYGVVGDLFDVVPELTKAIRAQRP